MTIQLLSIDIVKNNFQLHCVDHRSKVVLKKHISCNKFAAFVGNVTIWIIVMDSCGGANYLARAFMRDAYTVKLISPQHAKSIVNINMKYAEVIVINGVKLYA